MLVATKSFISVYAGREVRLIAGRSHVIEGHELVRRFPGYFKPARGRRGARDRTTTSGTVSVRPVNAPRPDFGREAWRLPPRVATCVLRDRPSITTRIRLPARQSLFTIADRTTGVDGLESGGLLFGPPHADGLVEVLSASAPGPEAVRERDLYRPDLGHDLELAESARLAGGGATLAIGFWHVHPSGWRSPSRTDLESFPVWRREVLQVQRLVALILVPEGRSWAIEAFTVRAGFGGLDIAERSRVPI
jgi:integrative and conjugative element protein (TIGR02256 family)